MANVVFEDVNKVYPDGYQAIFDLNLEIADGEFVILVGPSGCGKSTALRMVAGLEEITSGKLSIGDRVVNDLTPKERDIAMVFQSYALYPHMSVADNMGFALKLAKVDKKEIDRRVKEASDILGLDEHLDRKPKALSGGQRQRVAMGRAIVRSPQAFLMDEPLSNLDAKLRVQMRAEIAALQDRLGVTTVYVTHDQVEAMTMGDRVAVLKKGYLMQVDAPQVLYDRPDNLFVAGFMGSPSMNLAEAVIRKEDGKVWIELDRGENRLHVPDAALDRYPKVAERDGGKVAVGMRPEHFAPAEEVGPDQVWKQREVTLVELLGAEMLIHFSTTSAPIVTDDMKEAMDDEEAFEDLQRQAAEGGQSFTARFEPTYKAKLGDRKDVGFQTEHLHFFDAEHGHALR
ncbi:ABC transporter ATP-binding protein [Nitriliruptor alkaliphilus]|uniref:ABC transporter ATP-binding protein n=1 Tax=Nitriliruptor alkaliphilus TaxID=427918 RepID=UPI00069706B9|nr:sn-glycerol-3-phosphate ABC transporter ATP-binding protein UgpC [Nitriliruptor alkaliphilus]